MNKTPQVALIGNPNCGKTTLFNALAGQNRKTGNWAGVTVSQTKAHIKHPGHSFDLVDLPGIYGLSVAELSQDELVVKQAVEQGDIDVYVNVLNAAAIERNLFLTTEILELDKPTILVLNMDDERAQAGKTIDAQKLSAETGCPVIATTAINGEGLNQVIEQIQLMLSGSGRVTHYYAALPEGLTLPPASTRSEAVGKYLSESKNVIAKTKTIFDARFAQSMDLAKKVSSKKADAQTEQPFSKLDYWLTKPFTGLLGFLLAMYLMFFFAINVANVFIDFLDIAAGALFVNGVSQFLGWLGAPDWLSVILADGVGGGIQTVATFVPVIGFLFLFLTLLEESGYMSRAAFVMNDWLQGIGLSGKAFVPLLVSFGCNVPAVMATRQLAKQDERLITILMAPFMSCGARLSVYALFVAAFFTEHAALIVLALYVIGVLVAIATGLLMRKTILPGKPDPFVIELPKWRFPGLKYVLKTTWFRLKSFVVGAGKIIIVIVVILQIISSVGKDFSWNKAGSDDSLLAVGSQFATPIFAPMGIDEDNWQAVVGLFTGLLAKEVMVGTLDSLYSTEVEDEDAPSIGEELSDAFATIPANAADLAGALTDPLGLSLADVGEETDMAANQEVSSQLFGIIRDKFKNGYAAFAYLLFVLLYFPCVTVVGATAKEAGKNWATFSATYSTVLAYVVATCFYQVVTFTAHPLFSGIWLSGSVVLFVGFYVVLKKVANSPKNKTIPLNIQ